MTSACVLFTMGWLRCKDVCAVFVILHTLRILLFCVVLCVWVRENWIYTYSKSEIFGTFPPRISHIFPWRVFCVIRRHGRWPRTTSRWQRLVETMRRLIILSSCKKKSASLVGIYKGCNHGIMVIWVWNMRIVYTYIYKTYNICIYIYDECRFAIFFWGFCYPEATLGIIIYASFVHNPPGPTFQPPSLVRKISFPMKFRGPAWCTYFSRMIYNDIHNDIRW